MITIVVEITTGPEGYNIDPRKVQSVLNSIGVEIIDNPSKRRFEIDLMDANDAVAALNAAGYTTDEDAA